MTERYANNSGAPYGAEIILPRLYSCARCERTSEGSETLGNIYCGLCGKWLTSANERDANDDAHMDAGSTNPSGDPLK